MAVYIVQGGIGKYEKAVYSLDIVCAARVLRQG